MWQRIRPRLTAFAKRLAEIQAWVILTLFYFVILTPVALIFRFVADPLRLRKSSRSIWQTKPTPADLMAWAKAQF